MQKMFNIAGNHNQLGNAGSIETIVNDQASGSGLLAAGILAPSDPASFLSLDAGVAVTPYPAPIGVVQSSSPSAAAGLNAGFVSPSVSVSVPAPTAKVFAPAVGLGTSGVAPILSPAAALLSSEAGTTSSLPPTSGGSGGFVINAVLDASITLLETTNPTLFGQIAGAVNAAVGYYESVFTNSMTVTMDFGWGEFDNKTITGTSAVAESTVLTTTPISYSTLINAMSKADTSAVGLAAVASLPAADPTTLPGVPSTWEVTPAEGLALGLPGFSNGLFGGWVGLNTAFAYTFDPNNRAVTGKMDAIGAMEHEISENLGRRGSMGTYEATNEFAPIDLFRYTAPGVPQYRPAAANAYFSVDGKTLQTEYNNPLNKGDAADWIPSLQGDSYGDTFVGVQGNVSATDLQVMNILGYSETANPPSSNIIWTGHGRAGDFNDIANWSPKRLPDVGDDLIIPAGADVVFANDPSIEVDSLQLAAGATFEVNQGDFTIDNAGTSTTNAGTIDIGTGGLAVSVELSGTTINNGQIRLFSPAQVVTNSTTVVIGGTGTIALTQGDIGGRNFIDASPFDTFINQGNTIQGSGVIGLNGFLNELNFVNAGVVDANIAGAPLRVNAAMVNKGIMEAANGGRLILNGPINNALNAAGTGGGTIEAMNGSTVELDAVTIIGGTLGATSGTGVIEIAGATTLDGTNTNFPGVTLNGAISVDAGASVIVLGQLNGGTLGVTLGNFLVSNGTLNGLTLLSGSILQDVGSAMTLKGTIVNHGIIDVIGGPSGALATLRTVGTVTMTGGGTVALSDGSGAAASADQLVTGVTATDALDNVNNLITGYGRLGAGDGLFTLINEVQGKVVASGGSLIIATGTHAIVNKGLLDSTSGVLDLHGTVTNTGTVAADGGTTELDGATVSGGTFSTSSGGIITSYGTALVSGITIATGAQVTAAGGSTLVLQGTIVNHGILEVVGGSTAVLRASGTVALTGAGNLALSDGTGGASAASQLVTGLVATDTLDNIDNTISGYGQIGAGNGLLTLVNETIGKVVASGGSLIVNTGARAIVNKGLLDSTSGVLDLHGAVTNTGTIAADGGTTELDGATVSGGTFGASSGGEIVSAGTATLNGLASPITLATGAQVTAGAGSTLVLEGSIVNHGILGIAGDVNNNATATARILGSATLTGGGVVSLYSTNGGPTPGFQVLTGASGAAKLDNIDNTIVGYGLIGAGQFNVANEIGGTIKAAGGALVVNTGATFLTNKGLMEAVGGTLTLQTTVDSTAGGTLAALDGFAAAPGIILLDGGTLRGGSVRTDPTDGASQLTESANGGTLDGAVAAVTLLTGAQVVAAAGNVLSLKGTIVNHGTISLAGDSYNVLTSAVRIVNSVALSGGGKVSLYSINSTPTPADQIISGTTATAKLDNIDNTIAGYGMLGAGQMTLANELAGTIAATGGALIVNTGTNVVSNLGLMEGLGGTLVVQGVVDDTKGGVVATLTNGTVSGIVLLDGGTLRGGTLRTDPTDSASQVQATLNGGTLDGSFGTLTVAGGAVVSVTPGGTLTLKGSIANHGSLIVEGDAYYGIPAGELLLSGSVSLSGGGLVSLADVSGLSLGTNTQVITGVANTATLDNVDNVISGYGSLGAGLLTLVNEAKGVIKATTTTLMVDTGAKFITNKGLMESVGGTLTLRGVVDDTGGGTIAAFSNSGSVTGIVLLDGATLRGGTIVTDPANLAATLSVTGNGGTLDGSTGAITLAPSAQVLAGPTETLTAQGTIAGAGTISVSGQQYYGQVATLSLANTLTLMGGGKLDLSDISGISTGTNSQVVTGASASVGLVNVSDTITGYGSLGAGRLTLTNAAAGTIVGTVGLLQVDTGGVAITNQGLMEAVGGTLQLDSAITNSGTILAGAGGDVIVNGTISTTGTTTGLVIAGNGGTVTLHKTITGAPNVVQVAGGGSLLLDGGSLRGGTLSNAATGTIAVTTNGGTVVSTTISNAGTVTIFGAQYYGLSSTLSVGGSIALSGGGSVVLADNTGIYASPTSQTLTGVAAGDTLDNTDNTIRGYGELGAGRLTLINEAKGTIEATTSALVINTGSVALANHGLVEAAGGTLIVQTVVDSTAGGTIAALNGGTVAGIVLLDGGTLRGGTIVTDKLNPASSLQLTGNGGTLDGTAGAVTLAAGSQTSVLSGETLALNGAVNELGTLDLFGASYYGQISAVRIAGTVSLTGGGALMLADNTGIYAAASSQVITGSAAGATLDNAVHITGYGSLGAGGLVLINEAAGTIAAAGGPLVVDSGASKAINLGQMQAAGGTLQIENTLTNQGTIAAGALGGIVIDGTVINNGLITAANTGTVTLHGTIANAGGTVQIGSGATLLLDGGSLRGGSLSNAATGIVDITSNDATLVGVAFANAGTTNIFGQSYYGANATLTLSGTTTLSGGGSVVLADNTGIQAFASSQIITGAAVGDELDNVDNTITGYGSLGAGRLKLINEVKGTIDAIGGNGLLVDPGVGGGVTNLGLMQAVSSTLDVVSAFTNSGTVISQGGAVVLEGSVTGTGKLELDGSQMTLEGSVGTGQTVLFGNFGATETLNIAGPASLGATVSGFASGDTIIVQNSSLTAANYIVGTGTIGSLVLLSGTTAMGTLTLSGSYIQSNFVVRAQADGTSVVSLIPGIGTIYNHATASAATPNPVAFGQHHVGDVLTKTLSIGNSGTVGAGTETLDASFGNTTGPATASGSFLALAPGKTDASHLTVGLTTTQDGVKTGTAVLALLSDSNGVDGIGSTPLASQTIAVSGTLYNYATASTVAPVNFGIHHVGDKLTTLLSITNTGTADAFTEKLDASFGAVTAPATAVGGFNGLAAAASNSTSLTVGLTSTQDGVRSGTAALTLKSDGAGVDILGTHTLTTQSIAVTGTLYNYATAGAVAPVSFGNRHVGDTLSQALKITNTGAADGFTEALDASIGGATGSVTVKGTLTGLGASISNSTSLIVGLASAATGKVSGTAVVSLTSDGAGIDNLGTKALTSQTIAATATLFALASPILSVGTLNLGAARVGGTLNTGTVTLRDGMVANAFQESLVYAASGPAGVTTTGGAGTIVSGGSAQVVFGLSTGTAGNFTATAASIALTSTGIGTSGLANTTLTAAPVTLNAKVYAPALATLGTTSLDFGIVHVGTVVSKSVGVTNTGTGGLVDVLTGGKATDSGNVTGVSFTLGTGLASGLAGSLTLSITPAVAGTIAGSAVLGFTSHDADLTDLAINGGTITVTGTVDNYATAQIETVGGVGTLTQNGSLFTLNLGGVRQNGVPLVGDLGVLNAATGPADLLAGSFVATGTAGFSNAGFAAFSGLAAGADERLQVVTLNTGSVGVFSETIVLAGTGGNASGYAGTLTAETLTVTGTVSLSNYATAIATLGTSSLNFGKVHVGAKTSQSVGITNTATGALVDLLTGGTATNSGAVTSDVFNLGTGLASGASGTVQVGITAAAAGIFSGGAVLGFISHDGVQADVPVNGGTVGITGTAYALASPTLSTGTLALGAVRVGGTLSGSVTVRDGGVASPFQESLLYATSGTAGLGITGGSGTIVSGGSAQVGFVLSTGTAGVFSAPASIALTSTGVGTSGLANSGLAPGAVTVSGKVYAPAVAKLVGTSLNFGIIHVGTAAVTKGDIVSNGATGALVDVLSGGSVFTRTGNVSSVVFNLGTAGLASGGSGSLTVGINAATAGTIAGTAVLGFSSHDADQADLGINGGTITVSGTIDNYATARVEQVGGAGTLTQNGTAFTLNLGAVRQNGTALAGDLGVVNAAAGPADLLSGRFTVGGTTGFTNLGVAGFSFTGAASGQDEKSQVITLNTGTVGVFSETITLFGTGSNASGYTGTLTPETITVLGSVFAAAAPVATPGTISLGSVRVGGSLATGTVTLTNGTTATPFQESLIYAAGGPSVVGVTNGAGTILAGGTAQVGFTLNTGTAGDFTGTQGTIALTTTGLGTDGLANQPLTPDPVTVNGKVYAPAVAALGTTSVNFGIVHVGTSAVQTVGITNAATGALADLLTGGSATKSGSVNGVTFGLGSGLAAGGSGSLQVSVNASLAGVIAGSAVLGFTSHDADLADLAINGGTVTVTGTIDNYATAQIELTGGVGTLTHTGTAFVLNLGTVLQNGTALVADLGVLNAVTGPSDLLSGSFTATGTNGFTNTGLAAFSGLGAGKDERAQVITLNTGTAGVFTETIVLFGTGGNASGYSGTLAADTLTVTGTIISTGTTYTVPTAPMTIAGTGGNDTFYASAGALNSHDSIDGGGGTNTLNLLGGGFFDLGAPKVLANIQTVTAQESAAGTTVFMRDGLNVNLLVKPLAGGSVTIYGGADSDTFTLGVGNDTVVLGSPTESVFGGLGGTNLVQATAAQAGAVIDGAASGTTTLEITSGGTVVLNPLDTKLTVKLDAATNLSLSSLGFITAIGAAAGHDVLKAGFSNQTLQSIGGNDTLIGSGAFGDTFLGTAAGFAGDTIQGFGGTDVIDVSDIAFATIKPIVYTPATGKLVVSDATHSATVTMSGVYTLASFSTPRTDGHSGTLIKFV